MVKIDKQHLHQQQIGDVENGGSSEFLCSECSMGLQRFANQFTFKCFFVLLLSLSVLLSGIFWVVPRYTIRTRFDANDAIKLNATVQAYFRLEKLVSQLIPYIERLEYDIYNEIGVPNTKVAVLSMYQSAASDWTDVVFGVLSDPMTVPINPVFLSVLRSSFTELFLQQSNLTLTTSIFGNASMFEILKFNGGITVIPVQSASIWLKPQILFNFTLNNSISEMLDNFSAFEDELKYGLNLKSYENVYVQVTNINGSTEDPPVVVQASVVSAGGLLPQRLKQLAQTITGSLAKNLGLNNSVFGEVEGISLSSFLKGTLHSTAAPSPAPSPQTDYTEPSNSPYAPLSSLAPSPTVQIPCFVCEVSAPEPSAVTQIPSNPCPYSSFVYPPSPPPLSYSHPSFPPDNSRPTAVAPAPAPATSHAASPPTKVSPVLSPTAEVSHGSNPNQGKGRAAKLVSPSLVPPLSSSAGDICRENIIWGFSMILIYSLFCFIYLFIMISHSDDMEILLDEGSSSHARTTA